MKQNFNFYINTTKFTPNVHNSLGFPLFLPEKLGSYDHHRLKNQSTSQNYERVENFNHVTKYYKKKQKRLKSRTPGSRKFTFITFGLFG